LVDDNLCVTFDPSADLCAELDGLGIQRMEFEADVEVRSGRALNFVAVAPRHIVMPAGCPKTRDRLQKAGIRCDELPVDQYLRAEGALGCLTGILSRSSR
jgi:N-dimethylarginine dimethylaminohydrolase